MGEISEGLKKAIDKSLSAIEGKAPPSAAIRAEELFSRKLKTVLPPVCAKAPTGSRTSMRNNLRFRCIEQS